MSDAERYQQAARRASTARRYAQAIEHFEGGWGGLLPVLFGSRLATPSGIAQGKETPKKVHTSNHECLEKGLDRRLH